MRIWYQIKSTDFKLIKTTNSEMKLEPIFELLKHSDFDVKTSVLWNFCHKIHKMIVKAEIHFCERNC